LSADDTVDKILAIEGVETMNPISIEEKARCNRCLRILPENAIRCDHCGLSTNPADAIVEMKTNDELRARMEKMEKQMESMFQLMPELSLAITASSVLGQCPAE
jgi:hypothetical protein